MVFKRRDRRHWLTIIREAVYPRKGWRRAVEYVGHRIKRLPDTPHKIALGFSCGVFVSFSPLFGLHFLYAGLCAMIVRGNILAAFLGTFVGNPLTFPLIAAISYRLGLRILGYGEDNDAALGLKDAMMQGIHGLWSSFKSLIGFGEARWDEVGTFFTDVFIPYFVGGVIPGFVTAVIFYFLGRPLVAAYQKRRRARVKAMIKKRQMPLAGEPAE